MRKSNAQRQRAYRDRHLKLTDELDDMLERINQMVSLSAKTALRVHSYITSLSECNKGTFAALLESST